ncbi:hypothetical protein FH039_03575 [Thermococcus indicus]|uniref:Uncharacterized protein n=1 Tax=Thermococcus indicus TaxID=2586643 RepID=A0A4Y5SLM6_9EURY|nr:DUF3303 family protein [Thermococcus indicus]QDA30870.1 hypothetical protein FH039_03575 [Thermococcus indicus]
MAMFLVTHRWSDEEAIVAAKEAADFFSKVKLPEGFEFVASYNFDGGGYTIWNAPDREALEKLLENIETPTFKKNMEITEIVQSYPPTVEYTVRLWYWIHRLGKG